MAVNNVTSTAAGMTNQIAQQKNGSNLTIDDFFELLAAQLKSQNMLDPVDNTEFIAQMAQFSTLSQMKELGSLSQTSFAVSLMGKSVRVTSVKEDGSTESFSGTVSAVNFDSGEPILSVGGKSCKMSEISQISAT